MILGIDWTVSSQLIDGYSTPNLYGLLFVSGLIIGYFVIKRMFKSEQIPDALLDKLLIYMVLATIIGARLGHVLFYGPWHDGINSKGVFEEGLGLGHYVTLFDHPDKYTQAYDFGETSKVRKTLSCHWRFTASTCMTFGTKVGNLKADYEIFKKHCRYEHPHDHFIFMELKSLGRLLALSIPGAACHTDLTVSANIGTVVIDEWAIYLMIAQLYKLLKGKNLGSTAQGLVNKAGEAKTVWEQLVNLDVALTCT